MAQRGPLVTAVVVVGGLVGLMTANAAGGLVTAAPPAPAPAGATKADEPPAGAPGGAAAPTTTTVPTTSAPTVPTTSEQPAPAASAFPAEVVYSGDATGSPLAVAVAVKGGDASAYLCDGNAVESWLKGTATGDTVELRSADGTTTLSAALDGDALAGTVTVAGLPQDFSIVAAPPPAGLYRGENGETTVGWIILPDGTQVGIARTAAGRAPAPVLNPARGGVSIDGAFVPAEKVSGQTTFG